MLRTRGSRWSPDDPGRPLETAGGRRSPVTRNASRPRGGVTVGDSTLACRKGFDCESTDLEGYRQQLTLVPRSVSSGRDRACVHGDPACGVPLVCAPGFALVIEGATVELARRCDRHGLACKVATLWIGCVRRRPPRPSGIQWCIRRGVGREDAVRVPRAAFGQPPKRPASESTSRARISSAA